ncbi:hypothetical protein [Roseivivax sp. THAF30]|nr:hypothetical protein [Roseivivax sp. THAF30]QFT63778.1 hypothetical protein FIU91_12635 [Roseivivax sp. THAF30]
MVRFDEEKSNELFQHLEDWTTALKPHADELREVISKTSPPPGPRP